MATEQATRSRLTHHLNLDQFLHYRERSAEVATSASFWSSVRLNGGSSHAQRPGPTEPAASSDVGLSRRNVLLGGTALTAAAVALATVPSTSPALAQPTGNKPNILFIMGDDIGWFNVSAYNMGIMGYRTPSIDRIGKEGAVFTDWYGQQSCTAGRAAFITGQSPIRTGLTKVGLPGAELGLGPDDPSVADVMKSLGYATGQFGKNHLGDRNEHLPTVHGFDEFFGNHLPPQRRGGAGEPRLSDDPSFRARWTSGGSEVKARDTDDPTVDPTFGKVGEQVIENMATDVKRIETIERNSRGSNGLVKRKNGAGAPWLRLFNSTRMHVFTHREGIQGMTGLGLYPDGMEETDGHVGEC